MQWVPRDLLNLGYPTVPFLCMKPDVYMSQTGSA